MVDDTETDDDTSDDDTTDDAADTRGADPDDGADRAGPAVHEPMTLTDDEVAVLAGRRAKAAPLVRRLTAHRPAGATGRLVTEHATPPRITTKEMAGIRRARRSTIAVRERFGASDAPADLETEPRDGKDRPQRSLDEAAEAP